MSIIGRVKLFVAFGLIAALFVALGPLQASAATPAISAGSFLAPAKCSHEPGGENICTFKSGGGPYTLLKVSGRHFTPHGEVRVIVAVNGTNHILLDTTLHANSSGQFTLKTQVELCTGGRSLAVMALDEDADILSNVAFVHGC